MFFVSDGSCRYFLRHMPNSPGFKLTTFHIQTIGLMRLQVLFLIQSQCEKFFQHCTKSNPCPRIFPQGKAGTILESGKL